MGQISEGPGGIKTRIIDRNYPNEEGLTGGTQTQEGRITNLVPEEKSLVPEREKVGL